MGSPVTQTSPSTHDKAETKYLIELTVRNQETREIVDELTIENLTGGQFNIATRQAKLAMRGEILMMFTHEDIRDTLENLSVAFEHDNVKLSRKYTDEDVSVIADEMWWDNCIESGNYMLSDTVLDWMQNNLVNYDE